MTSFPIFKNFRETNIFNAFILVSILQTIILSFSFAIRELLNDLDLGPLTKFLLTLFYTFNITILSLVIMYGLFGFGGGMIAIN